MRSTLRPGRHSLRLTVVAGLGTLVTAILLLTTQFTAVARVLGIAGPVLVLGVLFVLGTRRSRTSVAIDDCHNAATLLLQESETSAPRQDGTDLPRSSPTAG